MASKAVEDAVDAYLSANWSECPVLTVNEDQEAPADGSSFIIVEYPVANTRRVSVTDRSYREDGGFQILINVQRGGGTDTIRDYGEQLTDLFRDVSFDGVNCRTPEGPFVDERSDRGNYFQGRLVVRYDYSFSDEAVVSEPDPGNALTFDGVAVTFGGTPVTFI